MSVQGDTTSYTDAAPLAAGTAEELTGNKWVAGFMEAGNNKQQNTANKLALVQNDQQYIYQNKQLELAMALQNRTIDMNDRTVDSQAKATDVHSSVIESLNKQIETLDQSDPQYSRKLANLTNSITALSKAQSEVNANMTTQTFQGHGSIQKAESGTLGASSVTTGQQIDAGIEVAGISADTQLGLADKKVTLDTTLGRFQAVVATHQADVVGAPLAQGQGNYYTGMGNNTAGFTSGYNSNEKADYTGNGNYNLNYGLGGYGSPMSSSFPASTTPTPAPAPVAQTTAVPAAPTQTGNILSGQIKGLMGASEA